MTEHFYTVGYKKRGTFYYIYFCLYLRQLLTDFQNSFTGTLCRQLAIMRLLYIPAHGKCVFTLPCEI